MCFGGKTQTTVQSSEIPKWVSDAGETTYNTAKSIAERDYPTYTGPRVAGFSPDQTAAMDLMRGSVGAWQPTADAAATSLRNQMTNGGLPANVSSYMSPYIGEVVNRSVDEVMRTGDITRRNLGAKAHAAGAFGDARHGVAEGELDRNVMKAAGDVAAQGYQSAYDRALTGYLSDMGLQTQTANAATQLAQMAQQMGLTDVGGMLQIGGQQQAQTQQNYDTAYQDFLNQFYYPVEGLNIVSSALSGTPYNRTQTTTAPGASTFGQTAGGIAALLGGTGRLISALS